MSFRLPLIALNHFWDNFHCPGSYWFPLITTDLYAGWVKIMPLPICMHSKMLYPLIFQKCLPTKITFIKVVSDLFPFFSFKKMDKGEVNLYRTLPPLGSHPSTVSVETSITPVLLNSGGRHWLQDRGNKDHWVGELHNLCAWGETQWEDKVGGRSLSRPTFPLNVNVGRPGKKENKGN